jgi:eukaryotic-like serine/threonine-protein kinase
LTRKLSELPYSADDCRFLTAVAGAAAMALEQATPRPATERSAEPAGRICPHCFSIYAAEAKHCVCGRALGDARVPHVLRGVFRFEQQIAHGTTGAVYRAIDLSLGRAIAMKALSGVSDDLVQALIDEARAMARVTHPNLAVVYGVERWRERAFLVQELLDQGTLAQRLSTTPFHVPSALDIGITLCAVLDHLHGASLIHCDIKPSNIGYTSAGVVKLFDFGLARAAEPVAAGGPPSVGLVGTPFYMSPEAIQGHAPNPSFDLWGLAVVLYETLAGRRPFDAPTTADVLATILRGRAAAPLSTLGIDPRVSHLLEAALHPDPARRPATAAEFGERLFHLRSSLRPTELARSVSLSDTRGT